MVTSYGVISDILADFSLFRRGVETLMSHGIDNLIINGDLGERYKSVFDLAQFYEDVFPYLGSLSIDVFVQPGNWERFVTPMNLQNPENNAGISVPSYHEMLFFSALKHNNLHSALEQTIYDMGDHTLAFLPGADPQTVSRAVGQTEEGEPIIDHSGYMIMDDLYTGDYVLISHPRLGQLIPVPKGEYHRNIHGPEQGRIHVTNINDLADIDDPERTVLFSHVPPRFDFLEHGREYQPLIQEDIPVALDVTYVAQNSKGLFTAEMAREIIDNHLPGIQLGFAVHTARWFGYDLQLRHTGMSMIGSAMEYLGINKCISGHIHETAGTAHDWNGNRLEEGVFHKTMFYNPSAFSKPEGIDNVYSRKQVGIVRVQDNRMQYQNLQVK